MTYRERLKNRALVFAASACWIAAAYLLAGLPAALILTGLALLLMMTAG